MEPPKTGTPKLPEMVMCGDHPSFTKTELNMKETKPEDKERPKERIPLSYAKISPTSSRTERIEHSERSERERERAQSEQPVRALEVERARRVRSLELVQRPDFDIGVHRNRRLLQAAVGSFRWPPYLVAVWVVVLLLTHLLHCLVSVLERTLPGLKNVCQYFRSWTEESWRAEREGSRRVFPAVLACLTGLLYSLYFGLFAVHALALWSVEPLSADAEERIEPKVTNYDEDTATTTTSNL